MTGTKKSDFEWGGVKKAHVSSNYNTVKSSNVKDFDRGRQRIAICQEGSRVQQKEAKCLHWKVESNEQVESKPSKPNEAMMIIICFVEHLL